VIHYLTPEQVLFIHNRLVYKTGWEHGVRDLSMLLYSLGRPRSTFDGKDLYHDLFTKEAALMDSLVRKHLFLDGNQPTTITAAALFPRLNGFFLVVENEEMVRFTLACAKFQVDLDGITGWLQVYSASLTP
jgi:death on curing protein